VRRTAEEEKKKWQVEKKKGRIIMIKIEQHKVREGRTLLHSDHIPF